MVANGGSPALWDWIVANPEKFNYDIMNTVRPDSEASSNYYVIAVFSMIMMAAAFWVHSKTQDGKKEHRVRDLSEYDRSNMSENLLGNEKILWISSLL